MTDPAPGLPEAPEDHGGLRHDLPHLLPRRRAMLLLGGLGLGGVLAACGSDSGSGDAADTTSSSSTTAGGSSSTTAGASDAGDVVASAGDEIPDETAGPFPADGSNGPNVLTDGAVVRQDLRTSFGDFSGTAEGVETTVQLTVVDASSGSPLPGAALYLWQCSAGGQYSIYEIADQNYLRGVQTADDAGRITFTTVFPGCYSGRWPHWHFEVFESLDDADAGSDARKTSQIALPQADCEVVYADDRYGNSASNLARLSLDSDGIFRDGWSDQLATVAGSVDGGYTVSLLVRV